MKAMGRSLAIATVGALALVACVRNGNGNGAREVEPGSMNLQPSDVDGVASRIAHARCDRAEQCDQVGTGKHYENRKACIAAMKAQTLGEIEMGRCKVFDGIMLDKCAMDIHTLRCADPLDVVARLPTCTNDSLCL